MLGANLAPEATFVALQGYCTEVANGVAHRFFE